MDEEIRKMLEEMTKKIKDDKTIIINIHPDKPCRCGRSCVGGFMHYTPRQHYSQEYLNIKKGLRKLRRL